MTVNLTTRTVASLKPVPGQRAEFFDETVTGLAVRVTEHGVKSWTVLYRVGGRQRRLTLGRYPTIGLAKARKLATRALRAAADGEDPATDKRAARLGETVGDLAKAYLEKHAKAQKRSWREDDRKLNVEVLPRWRHRKVKELTRRDVRELVEAIADRGAPVQANRVLALISTMLNFAIRRDWVEANVASLIEPPGQERSRDRVLSDSEIRAVWAALDAERPAMRALFRLRLVTAQRGGELAQLRWTDIADGWITIPATVTKNKQAHRVPLTAPAQALLDALPRIDGCDYVFAGRFGTGPLTDAKSAHGRIAAGALAILHQSDAHRKAFDFRGHDLRRTAATKMAAAGVPQADIAKVLNHAEGGPTATQVYNRYAYDKEKQVALKTWARKLAEILEQKPTTTTNVVPITRRA